MRLCYGIKSTQVLLSSTCICSVTTSCVSFYMYTDKLEERKGEGGKVKEKTRKRNETTETKRYYSGILESRIIFAEKH